MFNSKEKNVFVGLGNTKNDDPFVAGKEIAEKAMAQCGKTPKFAFVFCSGGKYGKDASTIQKFADGVNSIFKTIPWFGSTTCGELSSEGFSTQSATCMTVASEYIHISIGVQDNVSKNPKEAGIKAAKEALKNLKLDKQVDPYVHYLAMKNLAPKDFVRINPNNVITIFPGTTKDKPGREDEVLSGIVEAVGPFTPVVGGSAADDIQFKQTYQFAGGKVYSDAVVVAYLVSNIYKMNFISHGYIPTQKIASVTESKGKIVKTLNGRPAAEVYAELIGISYDKLKENIVPYIAKYAFGFPDGFGDFWIKNPQAVMKDGSLLFFSPVPQNSVFCLLEGTEKGCLNSISQTLKQVHMQIPKPAFSLIFSCAGRMAFLQDRIVKEYESIKKEMKNIPFIGFYTYGEQSTLPKGGCGSFNQTVVGLTFSDVLISQE